MKQDEKNELAGESGVICLKPVGVIRNQSQEASWGDFYQTLSWQERAAKMKEQSESVSELVIDSELDGILDGIEAFSHLIVLYWAHLVPPKRRSTTRVHPMGNKEFPLVGVFATGSPVRPNSILITVVRLVERDGNVLKVTGLDALNGSPILDIKPYYPGREPEDVKVSDWMSEINKVFQ